VRAIRTPEFFYSHNYHAERWPAGNPETGYRNCDDSPTKTWIVENKGAYYELAFAYRAEEELYDIVHDSECLRNLAADPKYAAIKQKLRAKMDGILKEEKDPRALGNGDIFDTYKYFGARKNKGFAEFEAAQKGQPLPEPPKKKGKKAKGE
jgi:N-sulfoglucosamine sulfohydrolase